MAPLPRPNAWNVSQPMRSALTMHGLAVNCTALYGSYATAGQVRGRAQPAAADTDVLIYGTGRVRSSPTLERGGRRGEPGGRRGGRGKRLIVLGSDS